MLLIPIEQRSESAICIHICHPFLSDQCKGIEENNKMGKTRDLFNKIGDISGRLRARMGTIKDRNAKD